MSTSSHSETLRNIRIVLVEPSHPGNIGSVARAMKTMGLADLTLVNPKKFPHYEASKLAAGAESVLESARVVDTASEAIVDCSLVFGTSVRDREVSWPTYNPRESAQKLFDHVAVNSDHRAAILFGRESSGLTNAELDLCRGQIRIDANPDYSSLNLASAVQIISYELRMIRGAATVSKDTRETEQMVTPAQARQRLATQAEQEGYIEHLQKTLETLRFSKSKDPTLLIRKLTRLYKKADLTFEEVQILRGILSAINEKLELERAGHDSK